jgi:uncharacterized membrane protein (DUF373 family)
MPPQCKPWLMRETRRYWPLMTLNERFEHVVAFVLGFIIAMLLALALAQLLFRVVPLLLTGALDPLEHEVFQGMFGMVMTLLIALEFKHSIIRVALRHDGIVQVKTVVLIALLALSRKFVILDAKSTGPKMIAALAGATLRCAPGDRRARAPGSRSPRMKRPGYAADAAAGAASMTASISATTRLAPTWSPALTCSAVTVPATGAAWMCSIFIASSVTIGCPA